VLHFNLEPAKPYLSGLMPARRKNMERMAEVVPESDDQVLQHFLSNSGWKGRGVLDQVAVEADALLGGTLQSALLIDASGITKKGRPSVGVARQWNGRLGKVDNCQVGVFAALSCGADATLIDTRLYLPKCWTDDAARCEAAGVPKTHRELRSKPQLALEMVRHNRRLGVRFAWVGMDGL
jgi:SRSO17 transposase